MVMATERGKRTIIMIHRTKKKVLQSLTSANHREKEGENNKRKKKRNMMMKRKEKGTRTMNATDHEDK